MVTASRVINETANSYLLQAACTGNLQIANLAIEHGADPNYQDKFGLRPIAAASQRCDHAMIGLLMKVGADTRCLGTDGMYPMALAAIVDRNDIMDALGSHCWDTESPSAAVPSALESALLAGSDQSPSHLVRHGADVESRGAFAETVLMRMACIGNVKAVRTLLQEGALWFSADNKGLTAIDYARRMRHPEVARVLIEHARREPLLSEGSFAPRALRTRSDIDDRDLQELEEMERSESWNAITDTTSPLSDLPKKLASMRWAWLKALVAWKAEVARESLRWASPALTRLSRQTRRLITALHAGDLQRAESLLTDDILVDARDDRGSPLTILVVKALILQDHFSVTNPAGHEAAQTQTDRLALTKSLLRKLAHRSASQHSKDPATGSTIAHLLIRAKHSTMYFSLVDEGLYAETLNRADSKLQRPLHLAAELRDGPALKGLLDRGADRNPVDKNGCTPLHYCALRTDTEVARLLINAGANLQLRTHTGQTIETMTQVTGQCAAEFTALVQARRGIEKVMHIFSPDNPLAHAVRAQQKRRGQAGG